MAFDRSKKHLEQFGLSDRVMEFPVSSATVSEAAIALQCDEDLIAKTLSFLVGDKPILIVVSGHSKIDNSKYKKEFGLKAKMIPMDEVLELIGHDVGGVCPFGINDGILVYLDESLKKHDIVYPACGSSNSAVKLSILELEKSSNCYKWIDVCK